MVDLALTFALPDGQGSCQWIDNINAFLQVKLNNRTSSMNSFVQLKLHGTTCWAN